MRKTADAPRTSSIYAADGTVLHEIASQCLQFGFEPSDFVGLTMRADGHTFKIGYETGEIDPDCMIPGLDFVRDLPGEVFIEYRVRLDPWQPGQFGTLDIAVVQILNGVCICWIIDWKFGIGQPVQAFQNKQLRIYGFGFLETVLRPRGIIPDRFKIVVLQPRCPGGGGEWEISYDELMTFAEEAAEAYRRTEDPDAPLHAGEKQCFYCPANPKNGGKGCEELDRFALDLFDAKFDSMDGDVELGLPPIVPKYGALTPERRVHIWKHTNLLTTWLETIHTGLLADALNGDPTPGVKAVEGRATNRYYRDEAAAEAILVPALADDAFTKKLLSPAQAEKVMKPKRGKPGHPAAWTKLDAIITQDQGKPVLVSEDDEKPALLSVDQKFEEEPETAE